MSENKYSAFWQVIIGLVITTIIYIMTLVFLNLDSLIEDRNNIVSPNEKTVIIDGYAPASLISKQFNTQNIYSMNFKKIGNSVTKGSQFSYQFWINVNSNANNYQNKIILMKGSKALFKRATYDMATKGKISLSATPDILIKCPMIMFGRTYQEIIIKLNTIKDPDVIITIKEETSTASSTRRHYLSTIASRWVLFTFTFENSTDLLTGAPNGIKFKMWVDDIQYYETLIPNNEIKDNYGDLFLFPDSNGITDIIMGNITYYNYRISDDEIRDTYKKGEPKHKFEELNTPDSKPLFLSAYNKMDIYNL